MKFANSIMKAYNTKWSFVNSFSVQLIIPTFLKTMSGWDDRVDGENIDLNIVNMTTPTFTNSPIQQFVANKWRIYNGRDEVYQFTITFRDHAQMTLYRKFLLMYKATREGYFDDVKVQVHLSKDPDWLEESNDRFFIFDECLISDVGQISFSNTNENEIAEFNVDFRTVVPLIFGANGGISTVTSQSK